MATCSYNCVELPDYVVQKCGAYLRGGISAIGILDCSHTITDFTNPTQISNNITSGKLKIVKGVKGEFPDASPVEGDNPVGCGNDTILDGFDFTVTITDANVSSDNDDFWKNANLRQSELLIFACNAEELLHVDSAVSIVARPAMIPNTKKNKQMYNVTIKWSGDPDDFPTRYDATNTATFFE